MTPDATPGPHRPRPDKRVGVFETLLVVDGGAIELDAHLDRLTNSARSLYGEEPPARARELVRREARVFELGRLRLNLVPRGGGGLETFATGAAIYPDIVFPRGERAAALSPIVVDRGLGSHKWADREMLDWADALSGTDTVPLLVSEEGDVLEASRANVFAVEDGALIAPPPEQGILPGIARARVIEIATENGIEVREEPLPIERLREAEEVFLTGSVRGVEPARALDGDPLPCPERMTRLLARDLRRRWLGA